MRLVKDGIFPITKDENGNLFNKKLNTGFDISGTIQGEGVLAGIPVLFIRTAGCNLRCIWTLPNGKASACDTPYSSFNVHESTNVSVTKIVNTIKNNLGNIKHVVISGGEPMLQKNALIELCTELKNQLGVHITIETNGTIFIKELADIVNLFSISPKLSNSNPNIEKLEELNLLSQSDFIETHTKNRINTEALQNFINLRKSNNRLSLQFKFVVALADDENEIHDLLMSLNGLKNEDIILMQAGADIAELRQSDKAILQMAIKNGWRYTPRLHIELFGKTENV